MSVTESVAHEQKDSYYIEDQLKDSKNIFHREVSGLQVKQSEFYLDQERQTVKWGQQKIVEGRPIEWVEAMVQKNMDQWRAVIRQQLREFMNLKSVEMDERDKHIRSYKFS